MSTQIAALSEPINGHLRSHVVEMSGWRLQEKLAELYVWTERMTAEFKLQIDTPAIQIAPPGRNHVLGWFRECRNGFGLNNEILVSEHHVLSDPWPTVLQTLLHELLHEWQLHHGKPGGGNYHNQQYIAKSASFGLLTDHRGVMLGVEKGPFAEMLSRYGVATTDVVRIANPSSIPVGGSSKLRKFSCGCTNVRCAVALEARCSKCGQKFVPAMAKWSRVLRAR